jgi:hypothetical protein
MKREGTVAYIENTVRHDGRQVVIRGWLRNQRSPRA